MIPPWLDTDDIEADRFLADAGRLDPDPDGAISDVGVLRAALRRYPTGGEQIPERVLNIMQEAEVLSEYAEEIDALCGECRGSGDDSDDPERFTAPCYACGGAG